jgi:hypothetical protein
MHWARDNLVRAPFIFVATAVAHGQLLGAQYLSCYDDASRIETRIVIIQHQHSAAP